MNNQMPYWAPNYYSPTPTANTQYNNFQPSAMPNQNGGMRPGIIYGRIVNDPNEITANEIPMDGSVSLFPTSDYSKIYAKAWNGNGLITTKTFVLEEPITTQNTAPEADSFQTEMRARLDNIEKMLSRSQYKPRYHNNSSSANRNKASSPKKEGTEE